MMISRLVIALSFALCALGSATAEASKEEAVARYKAGRAAYNIGRFADAVAHFTAAYEAKPAVAFLFNIAQSHRQMGHCHKALFFYRRFARLSTKNAQTNEVRQRITDLEASCPAPLGTQTATQAAQPAPKRLPEPNPVLAIDAEGGIALADFGDLEVPAQPSVRLSAGYLLHLDAGTLQLGILGSLFAVPYTAGDKTRALMSQILAHAELSLRLLSWADLRLEVGAGVMLISGLVQGNPFTENGAPTSGALNLLAVRTAIGLDVPLTRHWRVRITPLAFSYSKTKAGLIESIKALKRIDVSIGIGARF